MSTDTANGKTAEMIGRILFQVASGKLRLYPDQEEPEYAQSVAGFFGKIARELGANGFTALKADYAPAAHVLADVLLDMVVLDSVSDKTIAELKALPNLQRIQIETLAGQLTGRSALNKNRARWDDTLFALRRISGRVILMSPSGITPEELREGFHDVVHCMVDELFRTVNKPAA